MFFFEPLDARKSPEALDQSQSAKFLKSRSHPRVPCPKTHGSLFWDAERQSHKSQIRWKSKNSTSVTVFVGRDSPWGVFGVRVGSVGTGSDWSSAKRNRLLTKLVGTRWKKLTFASENELHWNFCSLFKYFFCSHLPIVAEACDRTATESRKIVYGVCGAACHTFSACQHRCDRYTSA